LKPPRSVGLVWFYKQGASPKVLRSLAERAKAAVSPGRLVVALWEMKSTWEDVPIEALVCRTLLGNPQERQETREAPFSYFGHITIRLYGKDRLTPTRILHALLIRRSGAPAYTRRNSGHSPGETDRLEVLAPTFTRDVANDIWHMRDSRSSVLEVVGRLARLACWSDEEVLRAAPNGLRPCRAIRRLHSADLVPVPIKVDYEWQPLSRIPHPRQLQLLLE
jgi:hypothetical protein